MYVSRETLHYAIVELYGKANHFLKIWFVLKHMGMAVGEAPVLIDTSSPEPSLRRLFSFGDADGKFFVPFAHSPRWLTMMGDAARSVVQTNISNWSKKSIVTCDPTGFLTIVPTQDDKYAVSPGKLYPVGLGNGKNGFSLDDGTRVSLPALAFAVWYGRQTKIEDGAPERYLLQQMQKELHLSKAEYESLFVDQPFEVRLSPQPLSEQEMHRICSEFMDTPTEPTSTLLSESLEAQTQRLRSMVTIDDRPSWLKYGPAQLLKQLVDTGSKAILLYGPPRTGKTWIIDTLIPRSSPDRETIQIHDGWDYEHLVQGKQLDDSGRFQWVDGPLKTAIEKGKKVIVLEEINRTLISQSLGEVFSLLELKYRDKENSIRLRSGAVFFIPKDTLFLMTMNTVDKSTEEIDDALLGRIDAIECPPRVEDLADILVKNEIPENIASKIRALFSAILNVYPLGHGYFSQVRAASDQISYYVTKVRPVLANHLSTTRPEDLGQIDNTADKLFRG